MISPATAATLNMLRKAARPIPVAVPTKRPTGGRPNPIAMHQTTERRTYPCINRTQRANLAAVDPDDFASRFVNVVMSGGLPVGQSLNGSQLLRAMSGQKPQGSWENLSATLAARNSPVRLRSENVQRGRGTYLIELK